MAILVTDTEKQIHKIPAVKEVGARIEKRLSEYSLPLTTKYGADISLTIDSQTYVLTIQLKDQNGNDLGTSKTVDLPLESVVVGGSYDAATKTLILTLQNGSTIEIPISDLIEGLQSKITDSNKLDADLVKDGVLNKVFTATERSKLDGIESEAQKNTVHSVNNKTGDVTLDADDISDENTLNRFVSAEEKSVWTAKQDALTEAQLAAVDSGIDSEKVAKIGTNETAIENINGKIPSTASSANKLVDTAQMRAFALPITTKYGANLSLAFNSANGVLTAQLKDQDGNNLGQAQTVEIDLTSLENTINNILALIPPQASAQNQLADKDFVNSSISTNTAYFIGTFNSVAELEAYTGTVTNNDYANVIRTVDGQTYYDRYTYNAETEVWEFNFTVNTTTFTAAQWAALNSGITASKVVEIDQKVDKTTTIAGIDLQDNITKNELKTALDVIDIEANPTEPSASDLTKLKVGDTVYNISSSSIDNSIMHANIWRGKNLGTEVTNEQLSAIRNGTFEDLFIGDYWEIDNIKWRIADMDYFYQVGDPAFTKHHLVMIPDRILYSAVMNNSTTTSGGYTGSAMYTAGLGQAKTTINSAFGSLVQTHKDYLTNAVTDGRPSGGAWFNSTVELMNEVMVYGCHIRAAMGTGAINPANYTTAKNQLSIFRLNPKMLNQKWYIWLRDVVSSSSFAAVYEYGQAANGRPETALGVYPYFVIG